MPRKQSRRPRATADDAIDLEPRMLPTQGRAVRTVENLLTTAENLLAEVGIDGFTTNLLAERAGVPVRTVYRYFPNKLSIVATLASRVWSIVVEQLDGFAAVADTSMPWPDVVDLSIDAAVETNQNFPTLVELRRAVQAVPELRIIERDANARIARGLARALSVRGLDLPQRQLRAVARMLVDVTASTVDQAWRAGRGADREMIAELKRMLKSYLGQYFDEQARRDGRRTTRRARKPLTTPTRNRER